MYAGIGNICKCPALGAFCRIPIDHVVGCFCGEPEPLFATMYVSYVYASRVSLENDESPGVTLTYVCIVHIYLHILPTHTDGLFLHATQL